MIYKSQIIVLHTFKYGERDLIVHAFNSEFGRQSIMLRGLGKDRKKSAQATFHNLAIVDAELNFNGKGSFHYFKDFAPATLLTSIRSDLFKSHISLFISELLYRSIREQEQNAQLYDFIKSSICALDLMDTNYSNFHIWFLVRYSSFMGFNLRRADIDFPILEQFVQQDMEGCMSIKMNSSSRYAITKYLINYLEYHLGSKLNIQSHHILHELMQ